MDRVLMGVAFVVVVTVLGGLLLLADLLRHAHQREFRLRKAIRVAQAIIADNAALCRKCSGHGHIKLLHGSVKCSACYNAREFLHTSVDL